MLRCERLKSINGRVLFRCVRRRRRGSRPVAAPMLPQTIPSESEQQPIMELTLPTAFVDTAPVSVLLAGRGKPHGDNSMTVSSDRRPGSVGACLSVDPRRRGARRARVLHAPFQPHYRAYGLCASSSGCQKRSSMRGARPAGAFSFRVNSGDAVEVPLHGSRSGSPARSPAGPRYRLHRRLLPARRTEVRRDDRRTSSAG